MAASKVAVSSKRPSGPDKYQPLADDIFRE